MKTLNWLIIGIFVCNAAIAQTSIITCTKQEYHNGQSPSIYLYGSSNLFQENPYFQQVQLKKNRDTSWSAQLNNSRPVFVQLEGAQILVLPNRKTTGYLHGYNQYFTVADSNDINSLLAQTTLHIQQFSTPYSKGATFNQFSNLYSSMKVYLDSFFKEITTPGIKQKYGLNNEAVSAIRQYYTSKLAHFLILPILFKNEYTDDLFEYAKKDIRIGEDRYWMETQPGRIFLKTFFTQYLLPKYKYNLDSSLAFNKMFTSREIRKLLTFYYLDQSLNKEEDIINLNSIRKAYSTYLIAYTFTPEEKKSIARVNQKMSVKNLSIANLFAKQHLVSYENKELDNLQKINSLKSNDLIILDYWASWCIPCREKIDQLKSDEIVINNKKHKIIFISVDKDPKDWLNAKYSFFNKSNSFRLSDLKSPSFYTSFEVVSLPRQFLIENSKLISENFIY